MKEFLQVLMSKVSPPRLPGALEPTALRRTLHTYDRDCARSVNAYNPLSWSGKLGAVVEHPKREQKSDSV